ncbi:MAG TPA: hypothetical protein VM487_11120 [Phycisphaerae bacterium]|nr:hypothetical protein [Phycisphaerae bacterium]
MGDNFAVTGDAEWLLANGIVEVLQTNLDVSAITANVRFYNSESTDRAMPCVAVSAVGVPMVGRVNEYHWRLQFACETYSGAATGEDKSGEQVHALVGLLRDWMHQDLIEGDGLNTGVVAEINAAVRGVVLHQLYEGELIDDSDGRLRRLIVQADAWGYIGSASA